jgi:hypothetical protein
MPSAAIKQDPIDTKRKVILDKIGDVPGFELAQNELMVAIYRRDEMTPGGIIQVASTLKEDIYQGKVGLVVKISQNFDHRWTDPLTGATGGIPVKLHDWIMFKTSDTWSLEVNIRPKILDKKDFVVCRIVMPKCIRAVIDDPNMVW